MQLKFSHQKTFSQTLFRAVIKLSIIAMLVFMVVFLLEKINFKHPTQKIKTDITDEIIKLK